MNAVSSPDVRVNLGCPEGVVNEALRLHGMPDVWLCGCLYPPAGREGITDSSPSPILKHSNMKADETDCFSPEGIRFLEVVGLVGLALEALFKLARGLGSLT